MFDFLGIDKILGMKTEPDYEPDRNISKINQNPEAERNQVSNPSMISGMSPRFLDLPRGIIEGLSKIWKVLCYKSLPFLKINQNFAFSYIN